MLDRVGFGVVLAVVAAMQLGCKPTAPAVNPAEFSSQIDAKVTDITDGSARVLAYRVPQPVPGACVDERFIATGKVCLGGPISEISTNAAHPPKGEFRFSSRLINLQVSGTAQAGAGVVSGGVKGAYSIANHQLIMEWSRFKMVTFNSATRLQPELGYVSGVEKGIALRVLFEARIKNATAEQSASFGFGQLASALAAGNAEVLVRYETVGIRKDILPPGTTISVTSVNDLVNVQSAFYKAIADVSADWTAYVRPGAAAGAAAAGAAGGAAAAPPFDVDEILAYYVAPGAKFKDEQTQQKQKQQQVLQNLQQQQQQQQP